MTLYTVIMTSLPLFQNKFSLRRPRVAIFAEIIKILIMFIKTIFKTHKKLKELETMSQNAIYICVSCRFPVKMCWLCQVHHCRICVTDFKEGGGTCWSRNLWSRNAEYPSFSFFYRGIVNTYKGFLEVVFSGWGQFDPATHFTKT